MPQYVYQCPKCQDTLLRWCPIADFVRDPLMDCTDCDCRMSLLIQPPLLVKASAEVCYDSPIDGSPITSWAQRQEDLKRNNCTEYDPGQKEDYTRRIQESEASLDQAVDRGVEEAIEKMPTAKRGKLYSELTEQGVQADVVRRTPDA